jgi:hypothetical protein
MMRSLSLIIAAAGVVFAGTALAQSTTSDPIGIKVIDEPTLTQQRAQVGQSTFSTVPSNQRNPWDNGTLLDLNLDGQADQQ